MSRDVVQAPLESVRRLTITKQRLAGDPASRSSRSEILSVVRDLGYVQWDPVPIVAPSHLLSLSARLDDFRPADLDRLLWSEKQLFQHWTPAASIVLTEDYPLFASLMTRYPDSLSHSWGSQRNAARRFLDGHAALRAKVLAELRGGPRTVGQFEDHSRTKRRAGDWSTASDVSLMLYHLMMSGEVMVVGHQGNQNLWGLTRAFLPPQLKRHPLSESEFERQAAQRAIRALGTANPTEITHYFVRGRYETLRSTLTDLENESKIHRIEVDEIGARDGRYIHHDDLHLLESMGTSAWQPRMSLLPPFDNMVSSTARMKRVFGFDYVREQFLPAAKRKFGTYVLPLLWGERFIGRIDPRFDRERGVLVINAVHAEPDAPRDPRVADEVASTIHRLAKFIGASRVSYSARVPVPWKGALR